MLLALTYLTYVETRTVFTEQPTIFGVCKMVTHRLWVQSLREKEVLTEALEARLNELYDVLIKHTYPQPEVERDIKALEALALRLRQVEPSDI